MRSTKRLNEIRALPYAAILTHKQLILIAQNTGWYQGKWFIHSSAVLRLPFDKFELGTRQESEAMFDQ